MRFKSDRPTWADSRKGGVTRKVAKFCWLPKRTGDHGWVWLENVYLYQTAAFTAFGNSTKWLTNHVELIPWTVL